MTDMRRVTISFDEKAFEAVEIVRRDAEKNISISEAVRRLILAGRDSLKSGK